jgi:ribosome-associated translation inhibitor RaiA
MRLTRAKLFAKTSSQELYAMIDKWMKQMDNLVRTHKAKSKVQRVDMVKHAVVAA